MLGFERFRSIRFFFFALLIIIGTESFAQSYNLLAFCKTNGFYFFLFYLYLLGSRPPWPTPPFYPGLD